MLRLKTGHDRGATAPAAREAAGVALFGSGRAPKRTGGRAERPVESLPATGDPDGSIRIMGDLILAAHRAVGRQLTRAFLVATALAVVGLPTAARAECELTEAEIGHGADGIPEDVIFPIDAFGVRKGLARHGIEIGGVYYGEAFANSGGIKQGRKYDGVLELYAKADMHKLGFWKGLCFHADGYQIHGQSITGDNIGALMPVSNLEALPATRLFELWLEQHLFNDNLTVKVGQLAADAEFVISEGGGFFLNGTWGWPSITAADLPGGGPAYPLATPGVRVAIAPEKPASLMIGVYNGNPAGDCEGDPQVCNKNGLDFSLDVPALLMVEGAYKYNQDRLAGTIKIGGWNHFDTFQHQEIDIGGNLIAETGRPGRPLDNNWGLYGIIDQLIWRVPGSEDPKGVGVFARFIGAPQDRNLIDFYFDGGITFSGMFRRRPDDAFAIGFAYTGISDHVTAFDVTTGEPVARNYEMLLEICYTMQLMPGWTLQPDFQYIWQPGGNVPDEDGSGAVADAAVVGARTTISF
jgi:porin